MNWFDQEVDLTTIGLVKMDLESFGRADLINKVISMENKFQ
jgi:hypothetical protein